MAVSWIVAAEHAVAPPACEAVVRVRFRMLLVARPARHSDPPTDANVWLVLNRGQTPQDRGSVGPRPEGTRHHSCWRPQSIKVDNIISTASTGTRVLSAAHAIETVLSPMTLAQSAKGYTGQSMASAMKAKIMETPPMENRSRSDIACPLAAVIFDAPGSERVQRESRNALASVHRATQL